MSAKSATLAKSLHTVSALVAVARAYMDGATPLVRPAPADAVRYALDVLGYADAADPHGLAARAVATLQKDAPAPAAGPRAAQSGTLADCCPAAVLQCDRADYARSGR